MHRRLVSLFLNILELKLSFRREMRTSKRPVLIPLCPALEHISAVLQLHLGGQGAKEVDPTSLHGKCQQAGIALSAKKRRDGYIRTPDLSDTVRTVTHLLEPLTLRIPQTHVKAPSRMLVRNGVHYLPHTASLVDQSPQAREGTTASQEPRKAEKEEEIIYVCLV